jgi:hypothetical protein
MEVAVGDELAELAGFGSWKGRSKTKKEKYESLKVEQGGKKKVDVWRQITVQRLKTVGRLAAGLH